jgi:FHS family Na+ dependent glucose MFS transporter 1
MALVPSISWLWLLGAVLLVLGAAEGTVDVGGNTLLVWVHGHQVGPFMNGLHFFFGLGAFLAPIIVAQAVLVSGDIAWAYWALALLVLPVTAWLLRLPSPAGQANRPSTEITAQPALPPERLPSENSRQIGRAARDRPLVALIVSFFFLYAGAEASFGGWIFSYAVAMDLSGEAAAAYLTAAFWGALTLGRLLAIPLTARLRPRSILCSSLAGCLASVVLVLLWPKVPAVTWLGALGLGLAMAPVFPTTLSLAERHLTITGRVTGWFFVGSSAGGMSLPWIIGQLFETVGPRVTMLAIAVDLTLAVGVLAAITIYSTRPVMKGRAPGVTS